MVTLWASKQNPQVSALMGGEVRWTTLSTLELWCSVVSIFHYEVGRFQVLNETHFALVILKGFGRLPHPKLRGFRVHKFQLWRITLKNGRPDWSICSCGDTICVTDVKNDRIMPR